MIIKRAVAQSHTAFFVLTFYSVSLQRIWRFTD